MDEYQLSRGLGWLGIGLGAVELLAPRRLGDAIGLAEEHHHLLPIMGLREIASGIGILQSDDGAGWLWSRVAGDALDLAALGAALSDEHNDGSRVSIALAAVAGVTALDAWCASRMSERRGEAARSRRRKEVSTEETGDVEIEREQTRKSITINRPLDDVYAFWRDFGNFPRFMPHVESVEVRDGGRSHWIVKGPAGRHVEWDAEIVEEVPPTTIAWRSLPGADVPNTGHVRFEPAPGGRGTVVRVELGYDLPGGAVGDAVAKLFGVSPGKQTEMALLRVKQLLETGEVARTEGQPAGRTRSTSRRYDDWLRTGI